MWVKFIRDYDYRPSLRRRVIIPFKAGRVAFVKRECATHAISIGSAERCTRPLRDTDNGR